MKKNNKNIIKNTLATKMGKKNTPKTEKKVASTVAETKEETPKRNHPKRDAEKAIRAAIRTKRAEKNARAKERTSTPSTEERKCDILVQYNSALTSMVKTAVEKNKINYSIITNTYFYVKDLTMKQVEEIKNLVYPCQIVNNSGMIVHGVTVHSYKSGYLNKMKDSVKEKKTVSNNNKTVAATAKAERKRYKDIKLHKRKLTRDEAKKMGLVGRNLSLVVQKDTKAEKRAEKEKKRKETLAKMAQYFKAREAAHAANREKRKAEKKIKAEKPVQRAFNLAA